MNKIDKGEGLGLKKELTNNTTISNTKTTVRDSTGVMKFSILYVFETQEHL